MNNGEMALAMGVEAHIADATIDVNGRADFDVPLSYLQHSFLPAVVSGVQE